MPTVADAIRCLEAIAPPELAEDWDNVGLLVGDPSADLSRVLTCLTLTPDVVGEAIQSGCDLVVTHHPLPFRGIKTLTTATTDGSSLWRLARAGVAVYSPHTAYDSAAEGINRQWADRLGLTAIRPITPLEGAPEGVGVGRIGTVSDGDFMALCGVIRSVVNLPALRVVPTPNGRCERVAIACGSGGSLLDAALSADCDVFLTGEMSFHEALRCRSEGIGVVLTGHYASERFAVETLAERLAKALEGVSVQPSGVEQDPFVVT